MNKRLSASIVLSGGLLAVPHVNAQGASLGLSPSLSEIVAKPGSSVRLSYTLINRGDPSYITVQVRPFKPDPFTGEPQLGNLNESLTSVTLLNPDMRQGESFIMKSNESRALSFRLDIGETMPLGDSYFALVAKTDPPLTSEGSISVRSDIAIISPILLSVSTSETTVVKPKIALFDVQPQYRISLFGKRINLFDSGETIPIVIIMQNNGTYRYRTSGRIELTGPIGKPKQYTIRETNVLAQSQKLLNSQENSTAQCRPEVQGCDIPSTMRIRGPFVGTYQLKTTLQYNPNSPPLQAMTSFVAFPLKFTAGLLLIILLVLVIISLPHRTEHVVHKPE